MKKILLVDDMKNFLELEISFLKRADCQIFTASNGAEAIKIAKQEKPDIILLDVVMPQMDGVQATRILKSDPETRDIPIVIISSSDKREECLKAGANDFLKKPINERMLLDEIKKFVDIQERTEERVQVSLEVTLNIGGKEIHTVTRDVSTAGAFIITDEKIPLKSVIPVTLHIEGKDINVRGEVVREEREDIGTARMSGIGVKFLDLSEEDKKALSEFLSRYR